MPTWIIFSQWHNQSRAHYRTLSTLIAFQVLKKMILINSKRYSGLYVYSFTGKKICWHSKMFTCSLELQQWPLNSTTWKSFYSENGDSLLQRSLLKDILRYDSVMESTQLYFRQHSSGWKIQPQPVHYLKAQVPNMSTWGTPPEKQKQRNEVGFLSCTNRDRSLI